MKEKQIIFSTDMVNAILAGRKIQTRRIIKPQPEQVTRDNFTFDNGDNYILHGKIYKIRNDKTIEVNKYSIGDLLYVRETWRYSAWDDDFCFVEYKAGNEKRDFDATEYDLDYTEIMYKCTKEAEKLNIPINNLGLFDMENNSLKWKPSIFMFKKYARIWLEVTGVRIERVQDITREDAVKEGIIFIDNGLDQYGQQLPGWSIKEQAEKGYEYCLHSAIHAFGNLWDSINKKRGYGWSVNPWNWVIDFKVIDKTRGMN